MGQGVSETISWLVRLLSQNREYIKLGDCGSAVQFVSLIMDIQRTEDGFIFKLPANVDTWGLQRMIDYLKYKESTADSKAGQIDKLAKESKANWWKENKHRFIK